MAWVRIEDTVTEHPKHLRAGPMACWLWVCGLAYCQRQLTDGFIPLAAVPMLGVTGAARALKLANVLVEVGLFDQADGGFAVHDYLDFNDTREQAIVRRNQQHEDKVKAGLAGATKRWQRDSSLLLADDSRPVVGENSRTIAPSHPIPVKKRATHVAPAKKPPDPRVREFLTWFQSEYRTRRHGADYLVKWDKHGALVKQMLGATDLDRLKKYAQILLSEKTDDEFIVSTDRGIEILSSKFSWLSDRLAAWEQTRVARA